MKIRQTNFPKAGDDEKISLRNSNYPRFPLDFAIAMKDNTPKIWGAGGNIEGNRSFRLLRDHIENDNNNYLWLFCNDFNTFNDYRYLMNY